MWYDIHMEFRVGMKGTEKVVITDLGELRALHVAMQGFSAFMHARRDPTAEESAIVQGAVNAVGNAIFLDERLRLTTQNDFEGVFNFSQPHMNVIRDTVNMAQLFPQRITPYLSECGSLALQIYFPPVPYES